MTKQFPVGAWLAAALAGVSCLFEKHKLVRRTIVVWAIIIVTWTIVRVVTLPDFASLSGGAASAFVAVVGVLGTVLGFYQKLRAQEDKRDDETRRD